MSDQTLEQLFESPAKVRLLRLFLRNPQVKYNIAQARERVQLDWRATSVALEKLRKAGVLKSYTHNLLPKKARAHQAQEKTYFINPSFMFLQELRGLVLKSSPTSKVKVVRRIKGLGRVKLVVLSGIFLRPDRELSRTDLLVVADDVSEKRFQKFLKQIEAEVGTEVQYSLLNSDEFAYRRKMMDRFLRDILERPHEVVINKLGV